MSGGAFDGQKIPQSDLDAAFDRIAVDACSLLRQWSDSDGMIGPARIGEFQEKLKSVIAATYFGAIAGLPD